MIKQMEMKKVSFYDNFNDICDHMVERKGWDGIIVIFSTVLGVLMKQSLLNIVWSVFIDCYQLSLYEFKSFENSSKTITIC